MKTIQFILTILILTVLSSCKSGTSLFNGKNLEGWHIDVPEMDTNSNLKTPFVVREGSLVSLGTPHGHLITDSIYRNYSLEVEYRFTGEAGNCGVLVHVSEPRMLYKMFPKSIEVQMEHKNAGDFWVIGEDIVTDNMIERRGPKEEWGSTEDKKRNIKNLNDNSENPLGQWNKMTIECFEDKIKVWVNGDLVNYGYNATVQQGRIAIQAEGSEVEFRKIHLSPISQLDK